jgi:hypothetical protein
LGFGGNEKKMRYLLLLGGERRRSGEAEVGRVVVCRSSMSKWVSFDVMTTLLKKAGHGMI